jgi:glycosyltransferase involved in cell wall biosynthesis
MKIAFVVSWLNQYGGAERVLEAAHELFPEAPVYTSMFDPRAMPDAYRQWDIRATWVDRLPGIHRRHQLFLPLYPVAFESLDLRAYDVVLSITSAFAHGILTTALTRHLCYCLTPARFLWQYPEYVEKESVGRLARALMPLVISRLREWDRLAAERVDEFIAISRVVQSRIAKFYRRTSTIINPPVNVQHFQLAPRSEMGDYFLMVSRLVPYKRVDLAVDAFNQLGLPLVVAGDGRDRARLEKIARSNIHFIGRVSDETSRDLMARCRAFVFPGEEDFGIAPLEANAAGRPVIAFAGGGALDTVVPGLNGVLFHEPTVEALAECVRAFDASTFDPQEIRAYAARFDKSVFQAQLRAQIEGNSTTAIPIESWTSATHLPSAY